MEHRVRFPEFGKLYRGFYRKLQFFEIGGAAPDPIGFGRDDQQVDIASRRVLSAGA